jgi:hypothetical protein
LATRPAPVTDPIRTSRCGVTVRAVPAPTPADPVARLDAAVTRIAAHTAGRARTGLGHDDADGERGSIDSDDAIGFDPRPLLRALHREGLRVAVIGQVAAILHGSTELTGDLDLLWDGDPGAAPAMAAAFAGATLHADDGRALPCSPEAFTETKVNFSSAYAAGDCCTLRLNWGAVPVADYLARAVTATGPDGLVVHYLDRDDLITMAETVARPKDLRRAAELRRLR